MFLGDIDTYYSICVYIGTSPLFYCIGKQYTSTKEQEYAIRQNHPDCLDIRGSGRDRAAGEAAGLFSGAEFSPVFTFPQNIVPAKRFLSNTHKI